MYKVQLVMKKAATMTATPMRYAPAGFFSLVMNVFPSGFIIWREFRLAFVKQGARWRLAGLRWGCPAPAGSEVPVWPPDLEGCARYSSPYHFCTSGRASLPNNRMLFIFAGWDILGYP